MKAVVYESGNLRFRENWREPIMGQSDVLVNVRQAGICETDLQLVKGYMGFEGALGHEFVGWVASGEHTGRRVVGEINCSCHRCPTCSAGRPTHCPHRTVLGIDRRDGAFAERVAIPKVNLHFVPDSVDDDQAVFVEPLAAAFQIGTQIDILPTDRVAILGDGRLGFLCAQVLALSTQRITAIGKHDGKIVRFAPYCESTMTVAEIQEVIDSDAAFDVVVDCTGSTTGLPLSLQMVRPRGTVVMKTTVAAPHEQSLAAIVINEINLIGSRCGPFDQAIRALEASQIDVSQLITHRFRLHDAKQAFQTALSPQAFKVVFEI